MKKSITKNYIYNMIYQILVMLLPLITTPYISRVLGVKNIGIYSYTLSISALFILFGSLGIALYGQREIAYFQDDMHNRSKVFWEIIVFRFITMALSALVFYFLFIFRETPYKLYYRILLLELLASSLDISWFFMGLEEFKKTVGRNILVKLISVICIFLFVKTKGDLNIYFWIYVLSNLIGNLSLWFYLPKYSIKVNFTSLNIFKHLKLTFSLFIPQIAIQIYTILDRTMIGTIIMDKSEVGYYDQTQKIIKMLLAIITSLGTVMLSRIAITFSKGRKDKVTKYMMKSFNLVFILAFPIIFGIMAVANRFVPFFFGPDYDKVVILMKVISPIILLIGISNVVGVQYLLPTRKQKEYTLSVVYGSITNVITNLLLIWKYGALGACIGTVIAEFTVTCVQIYFTRKDFDWKKIIKLSKNYFACSLIMYIVCLIISHKVSSNIVSLFIQVIVGGIVYLGLLIIAKDKFLYEIFNRLKRRVKKCTTI